MHIALLCAFALSAAKVEEVEAGKTWHVTVDEIPKTVDAFLALRDQIATSPQGGIVAFLVAANMYGENQAIGEQAMIIAVDQSLLTQGGKRTEYKGYQMGSGMAFLISTSSYDRGKTYYGRGYIQGTKPDDGYKLPAAPYKFVISKHTQQPGGDDKWKGLSPTSGADHPKPFDVARNAKGLWKVSNASSFFAGCKAPAQAKPSDDL